MVERRRGIATVAGAYLVQRCPRQRRAYGGALVAFARAGRTHEARDALAAMGIGIAPLTATMAERAAEVRVRHKHLRLPDAIVLACAAELDGELLTYDERLRRTTD